MAKRNRNTWAKKAIHKQGHHRKKNTKKGQYVVRDEYAVKAQKAGYRARSVYKLLELQERFDLIQPDYSVIDVWAAPGSFLQAIRNIVREKPILWIDIKEIKKFSYPNVQTIRESIFEFEKLKPQVKEIFWEEKVDLITSDIAPNTTGIKDVDQYASVELNIAICEFADEFLKKWWNLILKVFKWEDFNDLAMQVRKRFHRMTEYKPMACRDRSFEMYLIGFDKKK